MKFMVVALVSMLLSPFAMSAPGDGCDPSYQDLRKVFSLDISTTFHGQVIFTLCKSNERRSLSVERATFELGKDTEIAIRGATRQYMALPQSAYDEVYRYYENALNYNLLDERGGMDGSTWCLESYRGGAYTKGCFWSPSYDAKERGLDGLYNLASHLWIISGLHDDKRYELY